MSQRTAELLTQRKSLPIWSGRESLVRAVINNDTVVILGETGSGKTTQVPQFLLESQNFKGVIAVTQPRRVAAISLAGRVSAEQGTILGERVGYAVRFDEKSGPETKIKYLTDGMLGRELMSDSLLSRYSVIIVDEAHERTLRTDLLFSALKRIQRHRNSGKRADTKGKAPEHDKENPLTIIIMSATLDAERFSNFFNGAPMLYVKGRQHPVKVYYTENYQEDYVESALRTLYQIHMSHGKGDVLVFLSGQDEIESLNKSINIYADQMPEGKMKILTCPLYAALPQHKQHKIFIPAPPDTRKVVLATNIAETSITIPGIKFVIDTGVAKEKSFVTQNHKGTGMDVLLVKPISKSSARQRAGRAGREGPGVCFRLYTEEAFKNFREAATPEIQRCNLASAVLTLKCFDIDPTSEEYLDPPSEESVQSSLLILYGLQALDEKGKVTALGKQMANFPLDPPWACALLASQEYSCTAEVIKIVSFLSSTSKLLMEPTSEERDTVADMRNKFRHSSGDHLTHLNILHAYEEVKAGNGGLDGPGSKRALKDWCQKHYINERAFAEAGDIAQQLALACRRVGIDPTTSCGDETDGVLKSILRGTFQNCALIQQDGTYRQIVSRLPVKIHPSSTLFGRKVPAIVYDELIFTNNTYARTVSALEQSWIAELAIHNRRSA
ncbi:uncharacterized protein EI90DRAFT_2906453 [Cantharellus anzutake]|uniref:uncharacterized protein n=1 Tax=Cantharellus anzutake TaxID=1750568 RepID=UPI0019041CA8|nr:uncharacterized protein EI90DRAFT_2906453 [Cantharellus anzutake]KAF8340518.1 hypothetical protein EI90DRAFT_2906453 [Cantharellus anzutake]